MSGSRRVYAGLGFALITSLVWGVLPLVFDELLLVLDAPTVLCTRFLMATVVWFTVLGATGRRPRPGSLSARGWWVLVLGSLAQVVHMVFWGPPLGTTGAPARAFHRETPVRMHWTSVSSAF